MSRPRAVRPPLFTLVFFRIMLATVLYFAMIGMLIPTLPLYVRGPLSASNAHVGIVVGAFSVTAVLLRPWTGHLGDRRGRRILIVWGPLAVAATVALYPATSSLWALVALRLIGGLGEAFFYTGAASAINDLAPEERRGEATSFFSLSLYLGLAIGPVTGETLMGTSNFTLPWLIAAVLAVAAAVVGITVPETKPERGPEAGHRTRLVNRTALLPGIMLASTIWGLAGFNAFVPLYARELGLGGSRAAFATYSIVILSVRAVAARLPDKFGLAAMARFAFVCSIAGLAVIGLIPNAAGLFVGTGVFALGMAFTFPVLMTMAVRRAKPTERGSVVGTYTAFFDLAFGAGALSLGGVASAVGYRGVFLVAAATAGAGFVVLLTAARSLGARP